MQFVATLLNRLAYFIPLSLAGWMAWLGLGVLFVYALRRWRRFHPKWSARARWSLFTLAVFTPLATLFLGLQFQGGASLPVPGIPAEAPGATVMLFSALPWTLAGGLFGPFAGAAVGTFSGLLRGVWDTHSLFSILEFGILGALFAVSTRQNYRTPFFRLLRQPLFNVVMLSALHALIFILSAFFSTSAAASATERLDFAFSAASTALLTFGVEMLIAGFAAQILTTIFPHLWGGVGAAQPSPAERSIETRFVSGAGTIVSILLILLLIGSWIAAGSAARKLAQDRLAGAAQVSAQNVPFFLVTGQNLAAQIASDSRLTQTGDPDLPAFLGEQLRLIPFFTQLAVFDVPSKTLIASYPPEQGFQLTAPEAAGIPLAAGIQSQMYTLPPEQPGEAARIAFIAALPNTARALVARTDFNSNPYLRPLIENLNGLQKMNATGFLLDGQGLILYHPQTDLIFTQYAGQRSDQPAFFDETASRGTRQLVYFQPVEGQPWAVVTTAPASEAQQVAIEIALPIAVLILLLGAIALVALRVNLRAVTASLQNLAIEAKYISTGKLDRPLAVDGADELSELRAAFEQMRVSLQDRMEDLNRLLTVSQGVASSLTLGDAIRPVLEAVVASGASSARILLLRDMLPFETPLRFADGVEQDVYMHLDQQVLALTEQQERVVMATLARNRGLLLDPNLPQPASLIALALRHEGRYYGTLWAAYNQQHVFTESDLKFMTTLASQATLAIANIRLFMTVEVSRRQLEAILNSTPDPVLVTDASNRLILANPAATDVFGVNIRRGERPEAEKTIQVKALTELLQASSSERHSAEVNMPDGKTYLAMASPMTADEKTVGRVCILRDVTQLKEIDTLKSDFVATVSHDLRSPLTLMRGYATMLEMAGALNDQQKNYARMIVQGVDNMAKLVNNLLDLGRIEFGVGLQVESIPVLDILERATSELQIQAKQKNISLGVELPRDLPNAIEADSALLHQAVYNLIENGIKYTPEGGTVTVHLQTQPDALVFAVQDSGIGISEEDQKRLFEKFYRGSNREALMQRGTGLGLAIVRSIAERHGGKVWVESQLGSGSVFFLQVPLTQVKETRRE
ncbi:MAG: GAF domain-containing protein [Anaerolineales bacterium]|nr:GAF domain-containing protein [Anaerolineales bacterium]